MTADVDFDARADAPHYESHEPRIVTVAPVAEFDAGSVFAVYVEAQTIKTLRQYGLTTDEVNELIVFLDAHLCRKASE